jgi:hypothetical protein
MIILALWLVGVAGSSTPIPNPQATTTAYDQVKTGSLAEENGITNKASQTRRATWMEGKWGVRFDMPGMRHPEALAAFDVQRIMEQIKLLDTATWVQINLTQGANGSFFTSPHPELAKHVEPGMVPERDLFGEMLDALNKRGFKVIAYFATEGPTMGKHPDKALPGVTEKWKKYVSSKGLTPKEGVAEIIVKEYSQRYGKRIAGWWFDHAGYGDSALLAKAARSGNPDAVLAFNSGGSAILKQGAPQEDYTAGHPTPMQKEMPSWKGNEKAIEMIEAKQYIQGSLGHFFVPMQTLWNSGEPAFKTEQALAWTLRILKAGGAITWAVALDDPKKKAPTLASVQFEQLKAINQAVSNWRKPAR